MAKKIISAGAKEAVTGYEFQFTWTARRCISMLRHDSPLTQVCVESLAYNDEIDFGQGPETFLGVDTAEYHEGTTFTEASLLTISQLKCGISHPSKSWTIARLCKNKRTKQSSVIGRLASAFNGVYQKNRAKTLVDKLRLQVVSNCPLDVQVSRLISKAQSVLKNLDTPPEKWQLRKLRKSVLTTKQIGQLDLLYSASGLSSNGFCIFLTCLDLSAFGVESPVLQRIRLEEEIRLFNRTHHDNALLKLCNLVREFAQRGSGTITEDDVLSCFGTDKEGFFPARCLIEPPSFLLETDDSRHLAELLTGPDTRKVLAHGEAGVGKSITARTIGNYLPSGSVAIVYDCYANGETGTPDKYRFPETVLCTQLVNELSLAVGQNTYLIRNRTDQTDAWKTLQLAINKAAEKLQKQQAYLVLIIDAVDNAVESYNTHRDHATDYCFLPTLWDISLPDNVRLVFTCRTFRKSKLAPPSGTAELQLNGFSEENSLKYLRRNFPKADKKIGEIFHQKTVGVPRHQDYWLSELGHKDDACAFAEIAQRQSFGLKDLYNDWLKSAQTVLPPKVPCKKIVGLLRASASPVSLSVISTCLGIDELETLSFCQGLGPGIVLDADRKELRFRDEDYETFLNKMIDDTGLQSAHNTLAEHCLRTIEKKGYSPKYACMHLFNSGRHEELLAVVLGRSGLDTFSDPVEKTRYERGRIYLAFKSAAFLKNATSALRLLFEVGRVNRTDSLLSRTITEHPELVIRHMSYQALEASLSNNTDNEGKGKAYFRIADELSETEELKNIARDNLRKAQAWLNIHVVECKNNNWYNFSYDKADSAAEAIAALNLHGLQAAKQVIRCWVSTADQLESLCQFFEKLSSRYSCKRVLKILAGCTKSSLTRAAAIAGMYQRGIKPKEAEVISVACKLQKWLAKYGNRRKAIRDWIVPFLELAAKSGVPHDTISDIIGRLALTHNERLYQRLTANRWNNELDWYTQFHSLKHQLAGTELTAEDLFPEDVATIRSDERAYHSEEEKAKRQVTAILPVYKLRSELSIKKHTVGTLAKRLTPLIDTWTSSGKDHWDRREPLYEVFVMNAIHMIVNARSVDYELIDKLLEPCERVMGYAPFDLYMSAADVLSDHVSYKHVAIELIGTVRAKWCESNIRASEKVHRLMECSEILYRVDPELSKKYFNEAMEAASGVDDDACHFLKAVVRVAEHCVRDTPPDIRKALARSIGSAVETYWPMMEEEEHIPWGEYVRAMSALDSKTSFKCVHDMHSRGLLSIPIVAPELASGLLNGGQVNPSYALNIHHFGVLGRTYLDNALRVLSNACANNSQVTTKLFSRLAKDIMRDAPMNERASLCERIIVWGNAHGMLPEVIREVEDCCKFYADESNWLNTDRYRPPGSGDRAKAERNWLRKIDRRGASSIKMLELILKDTNLSASPLRNVLVRMAKQMRGGKRIDFLNTLVNFQLEYYSYCREVIPDVLNELIRQWIASPGICDWAKDNIPKYFEKHFYELLGYETSLPQSAVRLIDNEAFQDENKAQVLLPSLARHAQDFPPRVAYEVAGFLAGYLSETDLASVSEDVLEEIDQDEGGTSCNVEGKNLGAFLYMCFEQPDNRMRWRAFHAARYMLYQRTEPLLSELIKLSFSQEGRMWMSAREWLMFLFLHIAHVAPETLCSHTPHIYEHASNEEFPHAGIQELAKRTLLILSDVDASVLTENQKEHIHRLNEPRQMIWPRDQWHVKSVSESKSEGSWRFHFDMMDTFPYWYSPLARCFGLHRCDVAKRAEHWICDRWKITSQDCREYSGKRERGYDWGLFSHRHGSHPTIETLSTYIERHAMFMAAGDMIRELPVASVDENEYGSWYHWISRNCFDADPVITSDLRSSVPLQKFIHGTSYEALGSMDVLPASVFSEQMDGHVVGYGSKWTVVSGHYTVMIADYSVGVSIEAALVSPATARALARAMHSSEYVQSISIPEWRISYEHNVKDIEARLLQAERYEGYESSGIYEDGFELVPFIAEYHTERSMHEMDQNSGGLWRTWRIPGRDFTDRLKLVRNSAQLSYVSEQGELVVAPQSWSEGSYHQRHDNRTTYGHRLNIRNEDLRRYLKQVKKDLLLRVVVTRNRDSRSNPEEYDHGQAKIFILRQSGRIEGMGRSC